jgi:hypothetical protein
MKLVDPSDLLAAIDCSRWDRLRMSTNLDAISFKTGLAYVEPCGCGDYPSAKSQREQTKEQMRPVKNGDKQTKILQGKVQRLGDFIDTDAVRVYPFIVIVECQS